MRGFGSGAMYSGVRCLYGFDYMADGELGKPASLDEFLELCVVAVHFKIEGLLESAVKAATRILTDCFSYENEEKAQFWLKKFFSGRIILSDDRYPSASGQHPWRTFDQVLHPPVLPRVVGLGSNRGSRFAERIGEGTGA